MQLGEIITIICAIPIMSYVMSFGGWRNLARLFPGNAQYHEFIDGYHFMRFDFLGVYRNMIKIGFSEDGLYLSVFFIFRLGHSPIFIPWSNIEALGETHLMLNKLQHFQVKTNNTTISIYFKDEIANEIIKRLQK